MKREWFYGKYKFVFDEKTAAFEAELKNIISIIEKGDDISDVEKMVLLQSVRPGVHKEGKIEDGGSIDCSATNCEFCQNMRKAAETDKTIICGLCYDKAQEDYRIQSLNRHSLNMLILSSVRFSREQLATIKFDFIERICSSGETPNVTFAENVVDMIYSHEWANVGWWGKNTSPIIAAIDKLGKPEKLSLVQSSPYIDKVVPLARHFDYVFVVCATKESLNKLIAAGACECNGHKCKECGWKCYKKTWPNGSVIAEYLRCGADKRKEIVAAIEAKNRG